MSKQFSPPILAVTNLRVERDKTTILRNINWKVARGEHWVILGPNGCGKTSLLRSLTGYLAPTAGDIALLGETFGESDWRDLRTRIGLVASALQMSIPFAEPAIETVISGKFAQLDLWAKITRAMKAEALELLRLVGAKDLAEREWGYLSQGERQRVLIARALMAHPKVLILDEPCSGLDPVAREHFLGFVERLARQRGGPSLVLVTHHVEEIIPSISHALLLRAGQVIEAGPISSALTSKALGQTFDAPVKVVRQKERYRLMLPPSARASRTL